MAEDLLHARVGGDAMLFAKDIDLPVLDKLVGPTDAFDCGVDAVVVEEFDDGSSEAVLENVVLEGADYLAAPGDIKNEFFVEGFDEARIDEGNRVALSLQFLFCCLFSVGNSFFQCSNFCFMVC